MSSHHEVCASAGGPTRSDRQWSEGPTMAMVHLIRFPSPEERRRALRVFLDVPATRVVLPGHEMAVTPQHIEALERAQIAFEYVSRTNPNGSSRRPFNPEALKAQALPEIRPTLGA